MNLFQCAYVNKIFDTLQLWSSKILIMVCDFIDHLATISRKIDILHSNMLETIEEIRFSVSIKDTK